MSANRRIKTEMDIYKNKYPILALKQITHQKCKI